MLTHRAADGGMMIESGGLEIPAAVACADATAYHRV